MSPRGSFQRGRGNRDSGTTLVEFSVAMALFGLVTATCATLYIGALKTSAGTQARLNEINDGRIAVSAMGRALRTAILPSQLYDASSTQTAAFIEATPQSIRFYANIDNPGNTVGPSKVTYSVVNGALHQTTQQPNPPTGTSRAFVYCTPGSGCPTRDKILARGVLTTAPIFSYYNALGIPLTGTTLVGDQLEDVDSVDVVVTVAQPGSGSNGSTYALRIALPNHDDVVRSENEDSP